MDRADKNKIGVVKINDIRVIPVIFVPGVMGTNLMEKAPDEESKEGSNRKIIWRYDNDLSLLGWSFPGSGPAERKRLLHPNKVQIDNQGFVPLPFDIIKRQGKAITAIPQYPSLSDEVEHEAVYRNKLSQSFTLRSIIKIAQEVTNDKKMSFSD